MRRLIGRMLLWFIQAEREERSRSASGHTILAFDAAFCTLDQPDPLDVGAFYLTRREAG